MQSIFEDVILLKLKVYSIEVFTAPYGDSEAEDHLRTEVKFGIQGKRLSFLPNKLERAVMKLRGGRGGTCNINRPFKRLALKFGMLSSGLIFLEQPLLMW